MKLIFFDTEFTDLAADAKLISIGLVDESGEQTFYAELSDTWQEADASDFVIETVLPLLEGGAVTMTWKEAQVRLKAWLESIAYPIQLATDSLAWDWPWIQQLFPAPTIWPENLASRPFILPFEQPEFETAAERGYDTGLRRHHALDDAKANRLAWLVIQGNYS